MTKHEIENYISANLGRIIHGYINSLYAELDGIEVKNLKDYADDILFIKNWQESFLTISYLGLQETTVEEVTIPEE